MLLRWLDLFLSDPLRNAAPGDLVRHRVLVGSACFMLVFTLVYTAGTMFTPYSPLPSAMGVFYLAALLAARKANTLGLPALFMLAGITGSFVGGLFMNEPHREGGVHAIYLLLPALAVYLLGTRQALIYTLLVAVMMNGVHPLSVIDRLGLTSQADISRFWVRHVMSGFTFVGIWGLSALHSIARAAAYHSLERVLKKLRGSESKLSSIIESTDDIVASIDTEGRVLVANSAMREFYRKLFGSELELGQPLLRHSTPERFQLWSERLAQVYRGQRLRLEDTVFLVEGTRLVLDLNLHPILAEDGQTVGVTLFGRDITSRKDAEARVGEMHRTLVDVSRQMGMAEVATGVLHNVGNTLNSVNISTTLVTEQLRRSRVTGLVKATHLMREHSADLASFLTSDSQGKQLPPYLVAVSDQLVEEREAMLNEMQSLGQSVEHIKSIVSMQQKHARTAGAVEQVAVPQLIDEALRLHAISFERLAIRIVREYDEVPHIFVDRHKLLQILINLLSNARHALVDSGHEDKCMSIHVQRASGVERLRIEVTDNGVGIAAENMARLFTQGFTTKKDGHGFGLHISALAAEEMKGRLTCSSLGAGQGATFTLELPVKEESA
ncbi:ATP-binding protein [Archangium violaceum]|uniref:ATP-binding protein n=1 Tax=Archangium violaceum TaxID=83451 RepID=UPI002B2E29F9|nr:ATP-binding protein [Archangium gephyra]